MRRSPSPRGRISPTMRRGRSPSPSRRSISPRGQRSPSPRGRRSVSPRGRLSHNSRSRRSPSPRGRRSASPRRRPLTHPQRYGPGCCVLHLSLSTLPPSLFKPSPSISSFHACTHLLCFYNWPSSPPRSLSFTHVLSSQTLHSSFSIFPLIILARDPMTHLPFRALCVCNIFHQVMNI